MMTPEDYQRVTDILLSAGFSPELVEASTAASKKGINRTEEDQQVIDELNAEVIVRLARNSQSE